MQLIELLLSVPTKRRGMLWGPHTAYNNPEPQGMT